MSILGFDPGMGAIKLYGERGGVEMPSQAASDGARRLAATVGLARRAAPPEIRTEAGTFYVGAGAHDYGRPIENLDYERLTGSPEMRALFYGALTLYGPPPTVATVVVGLPIETLSGEEASANAAAVREWLRGEHRWQADGKPHQAVIESVIVTPQAVGALFDYVLDEEGRFLAERRGALMRETAVLSIGFNTLELLVIRDRAPLERFTAGNTAGVRRLLELLNHEGLYSLGEMDARLRARQLDYREALPVWEREVLGEVEKHWGQAYRRFERILVVGGGALLLERALRERFGAKAFFPDQPVLATARGLYKLARMRRRRGEG